MGLRFTDDFDHIILECEKCYRSHFSSCGSNKERFEDTVTMIKLERSMGSPDHQINCKPCIICLKGW